uniref:Major facilitator superfamily (MFS) profile domain-containing protein n=1 Tax=Globodera rostochiensis TaxID=31243 RepID=A0A914H4I1_GLORO
MYKRTYYITVLVVVFGSSFSFYSYDVVNPAQNIVMKWLNGTYRARGQPKSAAQLDFIWSVVVSSIAVGAICGALSTKPLAEKLGRRNALIANGMLNVFGALLELFSKMMSSPEILIFGRVILGANMGLSSGLAPMYLMEITPMKNRGAAATCHMIVVAFADWFSLFLSLPEVLGDAQNWPVAFAFSGLPAFVLCCLLPFCPESPKFTLLARRDRVGTLDALARLVNVREGQSMFEALQREGQSAQTISAQTEENDRPPPAAISVASIGRLFRTKELRMAFLICMWVMVAQQMTGCAAVFAYSTDMFLNAGLEASIARSVFFIERKGRRALSLFQLSLVTISLSFMSLFSWIQQASSGSKIASYGSIVALLVYMCGYGIGSPIPWMIASEIFPTKYRSSAVTVAITIAWTLAFVISLAYLPFRGAVGVPMSYWPFILFSAFSVGFVYFLLPETKNRHTDEIAEDIQIRSNNLRRHSLNILPTANSVPAALGISPSTEVLAISANQRQRLLAHRSSFAGTSMMPSSAASGKYSSLAFTPPEERRLWERVGWHPQRPKRDRSGTEGNENGK